MKKGRHRRFEEARALKRAQDIDIEDIFESLQAEKAAKSADDRPERDDADDSPHGEDYDEED